MTQHFTRRGFGRLAIAAGAAWMVPAKGEAEGDHALHARLVAVPDPTRLTVELHLRADAGIIVARRAIDLAAQLSSPHGDHTIVLSALESRSDRPRPSRVAPARREAPPLVLPAGQELLYSTFVAPWPAELASRSGECTLDARAVLRLDPDSRPASERRALRALARVRATTSITLPA